MNLELTIALSGVVLSIAGLVFSVICYRKFLKNRELVEFTFGQVEELEVLLAESNEKLESVAKRAVDQSRRLAWLETRIRQPKTVKKDFPEKNTAVETSSAMPKSNITERRHRVLSLSKSGQNTDLIAETLGMLPGEVELIINLNRATFAQFA